MAIPTKNKINISHSVKNIRYEWKINNAWNHLAVNALAEKENMVTGSIEEFIYEHYYGYTKIDDHLSQEYRVNHPRWQVNKVMDYTINCDFTSMYGIDFSILSNQNPDSVILAESSPVTVKWKRTKF